MADVPLQHLLIKVLRQPFEFAQYTSIRYTERLAEAGAQPSVGSVGDSYDNAMAETIIGLFKTELIRRQGPWRSLDAVELATLLSQTTTCAPVWHVVAMLLSRDVVAVRNGRNSTSAALRVSAISTCTQAIAPPRNSPAEPNCRRRY